MAIWLDQSSGRNREENGKAEINPCFIVHKNARKYSRYLDRDKWMYRPGSWRYFGSFTGKDSPGTLTC